MAASSFLVVLVLPQHASRISAAYRIPPLVPERNLKTATTGHRLAQFQFDSAIRETLT